MARQIEGARTPNTSARAALIPAIVLLLVAACSASAETLTVDEYAVPQSDPLDPGTEGGAAAQGEHGGFAGVPPRRPAWRS